MTHSRPPLLARAPQAPPREPPEDDEERAAQRRTLVRHTLAPRTGLLVAIAGLVLSACPLVGLVLSVAALVAGPLQLRAAAWYADWFAPKGFPHRGTVLTGMILGALGVAASITLTVVEATALS